MNLTKWYYIEINANGTLSIKADGVEAVPWHRSEEHWDESHIHIKALNRAHALIKANGIKLRHNL